MEDSSHKLGDAIREMIEAYGLKSKLSEATLVESWGKVVGQMIAKHTKDLYIKNKKLFVRIDSPALKNELTYSRTAILDSLNKEAGGKVIKEIVFL
jgi:predicted nucleic acid-binding Zn ribbon protein